MKKLLLFLLHTNRSGDRSTPHPRSNPSPWPNHYLVIQELIVSQAMDQRQCENPTHRQCQRNRRHGNKPPFYVLYLDYCFTNQYILTQVLLLDRGRGMMGRNDSNVLARSYPQRGEQTSSQYTRVRRPAASLCVESWRPPFSWLVTSRY